MLINEREKVGYKKLKNPEAIIDYLPTVDDVYDYLEDYNSTKKRKVLIVLDGMIADMEPNKKVNPIVTKLFLKERKLNISLVFISQSFLKVPKTIRLNTTQDFIMKIPTRRELEQIVSNHSYDTDFKDFMKRYKDYTKEPYLFLVNNTTTIQRYIK